MHHYVPPSKTGWPSLNVVIFPPVMRLVLDDPKQWPPRRLLTIHELILEDRRISAKPIAEQMGISREWVGSIIHEDLDMRKLPRSGSRNAWTQIKNVKGANRLREFWNFLGAIQLISCHDWWPWTKLGYITTTRRQNNNQWSGYIATHPAPKNSECKNPLEKFLPRFFWYQDGILLIDYLPKAKLSTRSITCLSWCNWRTFWKEKATGRSLRLPCSCTAMPQLTGHL